MVAPSPGDADRGEQPPVVATDAIPERLRRLIAEVAAGSESAFATLYDETSSRIYGVILRVLRAPDLAAEVTQDVYVEIWRQAARYTAERGSVLAWMSTVAHRRAVDRVRSVSSETAREEKYTLLNTERDSDRVWDEVQHGLDAEQVRTGIEALTPIQREAITLTYFGGLTHAQVADKLELPLGTVKTRIRDGLIGLRHAMGVSA